VSVVIVATFAFPDERANGIDHLHSGFRDLAGANVWLRYMIDAFGDRSYRIDETDGDWICPECRHYVKDRWRGRGLNGRWNGEV